MTGTDEDLAKSEYAVALARQYRAEWATEQCSAYGARQMARMAATVAESCRALARHWAGKGRKDISANYLTAADHESSSVHMLHLIANRYTRHIEGTRP